VLPPAGGLVGAVTTPAPRAAGRRRHGQRAGRARPRPRRSR
jgi:hypothetical protein